MVVFASQNFSTNDDYHYMVNKDICYDSEEYSDGSKYGLVKPEADKKKFYRCRNEKSNSSAQKQNEASTLIDTTDICIIAGSDLDNKLAENQEDLLHKMWVFAEPPRVLSISNGARKDKVLMQIQSSSQFSEQYTAFTSYKVDSKNRAGKIKSNRNI